MFPFNSNVRVINIILIFINEHFSRIIQQILGTIVYSIHQYLFGCRYRFILPHIPSRIRQDCHPVPRYRSWIQRKKRYIIINKVERQGYNPFKIVRQIHQSGAGLSALYEGFDAHLWGRLSYLLVRNTIYTAIYNQFKPAKPYNDLSYREKAWIAGIAGIAGAVVSHPFTVVSIRQILDPQIQNEWRRNYSSNVP